MTTINPMNIKCIQDVRVGMESSLSRTFTSHDIETFSNLAPDFAPVHHDKKFSNELGYQDVLVHGWLAASPFSGLLGMIIPGPYTVLHTVKINMSLPIYIEQEILYYATVTHVSIAAKVAVIELKVKRKSDNAILISGQAQCGFRK